ncbi:DnaJ domain-containing protein [Nocardioides sp.]|uniref:DnaJ domain-containing protein n=1 Tax=Nocardioides sp. TaxID=35761 RepID=UPI0035641A76
MNAPSPSWYDVLDVDPTASETEIRVAWKSAIADLDPSDRRFRVLNQAAEVLLDAEARAEYDESVAEEVAQQPSPPVAEVEHAPVTIPDAVGVQPASRSLPAWALAVLGAIAALLVAVNLFLWQSAPPSQSDIDDATGQAQAAAERAVVAIVSYDYRSLEDDQTRAASYMTDDFKKDYEALFSVIRDNAPETKTIISSEVVRTGIVRSGDDRVQIFMFINTPTTNAETTEPIVYKNQVTVTMQRVGDQWLVDDLQTTLPDA